MRSHPCVEDLRHRRNKIIHSPDALPDLPPAGAEGLLADVEVFLETHAPPDSDDDLSRELREEWSRILKMLESPPPFDLATRSDPE